LSVCPGGARGRKIHSIYTLRTAKTGGPSRVGRGRQPQAIRQSQSPAEAFVSAVAIKGAVAIESTVPIKAAVAINSIPDH